MSQELKKALHKTILKAMAKPDRSAAVDQIVEDIADPNMEAQVSSDKIPATSEGVLHKEASVSEMHQQKQMNAQAAVGMRPGQGQSAPKPMMKGVGKLKEFLEKSNLKKAMIDDGKSIAQKQIDRRNRNDRTVSVKQGYATLTGPEHMINRSGKVIGEPKTSRPDEKLKGPKGVLPK